MPTSNRVTDSQLQAVVDRINRITKSPATPYDGSGNPQAGCYHLSYAYGGVALHRMSLTPGCTGTSDALHSGHTSKRDLLDRMYAFIYGYNAATESHEEA